MTPITGAYAPGDTADQPAPRDCAWARNLRTGEPVHIRLTGKRRPADVRVLTDQTSVVDHLAIMARDNHQFAKFNQIGLDQRGDPRPDDLHHAWAAGAWGSRFRIHHGVAESFHTGRIALAGDAAHDNSPLGGQGMNAGIGDAVALGAALDAAIERRSTHPLVVYSAARRPVAQQIVAVTNRLTWLATMDRQVRGLRNALLAAFNPVASRRLAWRLSLLAYR